MTTLPNSKLRHVVREVDLYQYREVFLVMEWRAGCVFRTRKLGKYIHIDQIVGLDTNKYIVASLSTLHHETAKESPDHTIVLDAFTDLK